MRRSLLERTAGAAFLALLVLSASQPAMAAPDPSAGGTAARLSIASPESGQSVAGRIQVSIAFDAGPDIGKFTAVSLWVDGRMAMSRVLVGDGRRGTDFLDLDTRRLSNGQHAVKITVHAGPRNEVVASDTIRILVNNGGIDTIPPLVSIRNFLEGDTVWGRINLEAHVTDNDQVSLVAIYVNRALELLSNRPPYSITLDTADPRYSDSAGRGVLKVEAWAFDRSENLGKSRLLTLNIDQKQNATRKQADPAAPQPNRDPVVPERVDRPGGLAGAAPGGPASSPAPGRQARPAEPRIVGVDAVPEFARGMRGGTPERIRRNPAGRPAPAPQANAPGPRVESVDAAPEIVGGTRGGAPETTRPQEPQPLGADASPAALAEGSPVTPGESPVQMARVAPPQLPEVRGDGLPAASMETGGVPAGIRIEPGQIEVPLGGSVAPEPAGKPARATDIKPVRADRGRYYMLVMLPNARPNEYGRIELVSVAVGTGGEPVQRDRTYTVQHGDTLWEISHRFGVTPRSVRVASGLPEKLRLRPGMKLRVPGTFRVAIEDQPVRFDVPPRVDGGIPLAPFRQIFEHAGGKVMWIKETREVHGSKPDTEVRLKIGSDQALINGETILLDQPAFIDRGRTIVPIRFIEQALDVKAEYDVKSGTIHLVRR
ncbi:MAG: LysM peptidoglycan-binding domain-containing protein [Armatimonadetes bacterium]|nr:LysM peptidoglycan-binding domain-containing protein [Armatimonadota bacterium]